MRTIANKIMVRQMLRLAACTFIGLSMAACAGDDTATSQEQGGNEDKNPAGTTIFSCVDQSNESAPSTRTAIVDHIKGGGAKVNWSATDKIWVKDDAGTWKQSAAAAFTIATNKSNAWFTLNGTYTGMTHDVIYTNTSITGTPQVEIKATQTQSAPNNFDHAGESGDCGIAEATKNIYNDYDFTLNHKASYICLIPRSSNEFVHRSKLTRIEIVSDNNIAGTYDIAADGTLTLASGGSKTITLTTGTGFDLDNTADDMDKNAAYVVIAPGTHSLRIRYWLKNNTDYNGGLIEGTVTKYVTMTFEAGKIHDITANLNPKDYDGTKYYMWDAQQNYWWQHEWNSATPWQPTVNGSGNPNYPKSKSTDPQRWYNDSYSGVAYEAQTTLFSSSPNANEMVWYAAKGDPRWDADELWTTMGHMYKGGMWFLKKANIANFNTLRGPDGTTDYRTVIGTINNTSLNSGLPSVNDIGKYFYLPAMGYLLNGQLNNVGLLGNHWSSSIHLRGNIHAYVIYFNSNSANVNSSMRHVGYQMGTFE